MIDDKMKAERGIASLLADSDWSNKIINTPSREIYAQIPPRVEYMLTDMGHSLIPILQEINKWGTANINVQASEPDSAL